MAIQMRRGELADYDPDQMLAGEFAVATDEEELYIAFSTGNSKRVLLEGEGGTVITPSISDGNLTFTIS